MATIYQLEVCQSQQDSFYGLRNKWCSNLSFSLFLFVLNIIHWKYLLEFLVQSRQNWRNDTFIFSYAIYWSVLFWALFWANPINVILSEASRIFRDNFSAADLRASVSQKQAMTYYILTLKKIIEANFLPITCMTMVILSFTLWWAPDPLKHCIWTKFNNVSWGYGQPWCQLSNNKENEGGKGRLSRNGLEGRE